MAARDDNNLVRPGEVRRLFGVSDVTMSRWRRSGRLRPAMTTIGGHARYRWGDVKRALGEAATIAAERAKPSAATSYFEQLHHIRHGEVVRPIWEEQLPATRTPSGQSQVLESRDREPRATFAAPPSEEDLAKRAAERAKQKKEGKGITDLFSTIWLTRHPPPAAQVPDVPQRRREKAVAQRRAAATTFFPKRFGMRREELYDLVWSEPMTIVAAGFGLSDNGLRKTCKKFMNPLPPRGYWASLRGERCTRCFVRPRLRSL
jgi:hypothetical protein